MCLLYSDEAERVDVLARYIESGVQDGDVVSYFADVDEPDAVEAALAPILARVVVPPGPGRLRATRAIDTYCPDRTFSADRMLQTLTHAHEHAIIEGYAGARVTGEMTWSRRGLPGSDALVEYEGRINQLARTTPTTAVCQYDTRRFDGRTLYDVLRVHPMMIVRGQVVENPYYVEPDTVWPRRAGE